MRSHLELLLVVINDAIDPQPAEHLGLPGAPAGRDDVAPGQLGQLDRKLAGAACRCRNKDSLPALELTSNLKRCDGG